VFRLLRLGFLSRGGIAKGPAYHRDGKVFGPAILEAYRLENRVAVFPRVILQPEIVKAGLHIGPPIDQLFARMIKSNEDGFYMVNSLWALRMAADSESGLVGEWRESVDGIARFLSEEEAILASEPTKLKKARLDSESTKVGGLEQVRWFRKYFDWATDRSWVDKIQAPFPK
jgi:hypothetical protein